MTRINIHSRKYLPTPLPDICAPRTELLGYIEAAQKRSMVFFYAPAGSGKTVTALLWLKASNRIPIWVGLDTYDNSVTTFYRLLCTGLLSVQKENAGISEILSNPLFDSSPVEQTIRCMDEFATDDGSQYAIVLDDFHLIGSRGITESLLPVLRHLPDSFTVCILSRKEPEGEFAKLRYAGGICVIDAAKLAFKENEAADFFGALGRADSASEAKAAIEMTDGWAIGINALSHSSQTIRTEGSRREIHRLFDDILWSEWDDETKDFMLKSAIMDIMPADLTAKITGRADAELLLENLLSGNVFVMQTDAQTYRYHHLFLEYLRAKPEFTSDTEAYEKCCLTAAEWCAEQGDYITSRRYAVKSGNFSALLDVWDRFLDSRQHSIPNYISYMQEFLENENIEEYCRQYPVIYISLAWMAFLQGDADAFEAYEDELKRYHETISEKYPHFAESSAALLCIDYRTSFAELMGQAAFLNPVEFKEDGMHLASVSLQMPCFHRSTRDYFELSDPSLIAPLEKTFGRFLKNQFTLIVLGIASALQLEQNRIEAAVANALKGVALLTPDTDDEIRFGIRMHQVSAYYAKGMRKEAEGILDRTETQLAGEAPFLLPNLAAFRARILIWEGNLRAAREYIANYFADMPEGSQTDIKVPLYRIYQFFTAARAYILMGRYETAEAVLLGLLRLGSSFRRPFDTAEAQTLLAALYWAWGRRDKALDYLQAALLLMQPHTFIRTVADEGEAIRAPLKRLLDRAGSAEYVGDLDAVYLNSVYLAAHAVSKQRSGIVIPHPTKPVRLSKQQTLIIGLLAQGYKREAIVAKTGLSLNTIKTHLRLLYQKLDVTNAADAVSKGHSLGLIPPR